VRPETIDSKKAALDGPLLFPLGTFRFAAPAKKPIARPCACMAVRANEIRTRTLPRVKRTSRKREAMSVYEQSAN